jgi:hypothetical protein
MTEGHYDDRSDWGGRSTWRRLSGSGLSRHRGAAGRHIIVEDFGESAGHAVDVGANRIAGPARRWAVRLNSGELIFVDSSQLSAL